VSVTADEQLMKAPDVARMLNVSRAWVYRAAERGLIPSVRLGGDDGPLRFVRADLEAWVENARRGGGARAPPAPGPATPGPPRCNGLRTRRRRADARR
jgi:excisionase family DNA binding protein